ncbi:MAG TPA: helix-turn-helix domain-containing protein [Candidatus Binataceae bacterium]|nr:helix-turn-helix domain-containing protein [Candidatus Binataceae bacterium]
MNEIKAVVAGMVDKNGKPSADEFKIVTDQIRAAADQLKVGMDEPLADHSSIALNQVFAQTRTSVEAASAVEPMAQPARVTESKPSVSAVPAHKNGTNGGSNGASADGEIRAIDLLSAVADTSEQALQQDRQEPDQSPSVPPIIDLSNPTADQPLERRPLGSSKTVIGASITLPGEASVGRMGEAFPERTSAEPTANGAPKNPESSEPSLGMYLLASREKRVVTREDAARDTRIPAHYLRMMESNDYSMIADQLYLLPFLRRYSEYLGLDSEDVAIRFVREVQRAENSPGPALPSSPVDTERAPSNLWAILGALAVVAIIAGWMLLHQRHHLDGDETTDVNPQHDVMPNDNSGPPLPETVQSDVQGTMPAASVASATIPSAQNQPASEVPAPVQHAAPVHFASEPVPPPGGTE